MDRLRPPFRGDFRAGAAGRPGAGGAIRLSAGNALDTDWRDPGRGGAGFSGFVFFAAAGREIAGPDGQRGIEHHGGAIALVAILAIMVILLAVLALVVVKALAESS